MVGNYTYTRFIKLLYYFGVIEGAAGSVELKLDKDDELEELGCSVSLFALLLNSASVVKPIPAGLARKINVNSCRSFNILAIFR